MSAVVTADPRVNGKGARRQCTAKSKRTGVRCLRPPIRGRTVCYHHGGMSLVGPFNPRYTTGARSRYAVPPALVDAVQRARDAGRPLDLTDELEILRGVVQARLIAVGAGSSGALAELVHTIGAVRKVAETEHRRMLAGQGYIGAPAVLHFAARLVDIARHHLPADRHAAFAQEMAEAMGVALPSPVVDVTPGGNGRPRT